MRTTLSFLGSLVLIAALAAPVAAQGKQPPAAPPATPGLAEHDAKILNVVQDCAKKATAALENWIKTKEISKKRLFSRLYFPIPNTTPPKFTTPWLKLGKRDIEPIIDKCVVSDGSLLYVILVDTNGYTGLHNKKYRHKMTGDSAQDLKRNRTKRIFNDKVGIAAARNKKPHLLQTYQRDTGEKIKDLSVPVIVGGQHFGAIRAGYKVQ